MSVPITLVSAAPNPFYPDGGQTKQTTTIVYTLAYRSRVWIQVFSSGNKLVRTLVSARALPAGSHQAIWDGRSGRRRKVPEDIYTVRITARTGSGYYTAATAVILASRLAEYSRNPVYSLGDWMMACPCVLFDANRFGVPGGAPYLMWCGASEPSALTPQVRMASSSDGITWDDQGPVSGLTNPDHCFVLHNTGWTGSKFKMWYLDSTVNDSIAALRYAESNTGLTWFNDRALAQDRVNRLVTGDPDTWNRFTAGPRFVIYTPGAPNAGIYPQNHTYAMYYSVSPDTEKQVTALAYSSDGLYWHVARNYPVLAGTNFGGEEHLGTQYSWDEYAVLLNSIARSPSGMWIAYYCAGDDLDGAYKGIGLAMSSDGLNWTTVSSSDPLLHVNDSVAWRDSKTFDPFIIRDANMFSGFGDAVWVKAWFAGAEEPDSHGYQNSGIGYAVRTTESQF